jgi:hypothetical protein
MKLHSQQQNNPGSQPQGLGFREVDADFFLLGFSNASACVLLVILTRFFYPGYLEEGEVLGLDSNCYFHGIR